MSDWFDAAQARRYAGDLRQAARIDRFVREDGMGRGNRVVRVVTGGGLEFELLPDRGLDLGTVTVDGIPVAWAAPTPPTSAERFEPEGAGWVRSFSGGMVVTCGLDQFGAPGEDARGKAGQHGRASSLSAEHLSTSVPDQPGDDSRLVVSGRMRQAALFGENLAWRRSVTADLGGRGLEVVDEIANLGARPAPHLVLYHVNFGWPLLAPGATVSANPEPLEVAARDAESEPGVSGWREIPEPAAPDAPEHVLRHRLAGGRMTYRVERAELGLGAELSFDSAELPWLYQWRLFRPGEYVLALEPATADAIRGRPEAASRGAVPELAPGESRRTSFRLDFDRA